MSITPPFLLLNFCCSFTLLLPCPQFPCNREEKCPELGEEEEDQLPTEEGDRAQVAHHGPQRDVRRRQLQLCGHPPANAHAARPAAHAVVHCYLRGKHLIKFLSVLCVLNVQGD